MNCLHFIGGGVKRHDVLRADAATPIEGRAVPLAESVKAIAHEGVDAAFDAAGGAQTSQCLKALKPRGTLVWYGFTGATGLPALIRSAFNTFVWSKLSGRRGAFYGIIMLCRKRPKPLLEDLTSDQTTHRPAPATARRPRSE